jgi:hypothetical protein
MTAPGADVFVDRFGLECPVVQVRMSDGEAQVKARGLWAAGAWPAAGGDRAEDYHEAEHREREPPEQTHVSPDTRGAHVQSACLPASATIADAPVEGHGVGQEEHHQDEVRGDELGGELEQDRDAAQNSLADVADEEPEREPDESRRSRRRMASRNASSTSTHTAVITIDVPVRWYPAAGLARAGSSQSSSDRHDGRTTRPRGFCPPVF